MLAGQGAAQIHVQNEGDDLRDLELVDLRPFLISFSKNESSAGTTKAKISKAIATFKSRNKCSGSFSKVPASDEA